MPEDERGQDDREIIIRLERLIRRSRGFTLAFVKANQEARRRLLAASLAAHLADLRILEIRLDSSIVSILSEVNERIVTDAAPDAVCVFGLEHSLDSGDDSPILGRLNHERDLLRRSLPFPVLMWVSDFALDAIVRGAPDFWAWRSGVYEFGDAERLRQSGALLAQHDAALLTSPYTAEVLGAWMHFMRKGRMSEVLRGKEILARLWHRRALLDASSGNWQDARLHLGQELEITRATGDGNGTGEALLQLANVELAAGEIAKAEGFFQESARVFRDAGNALQTARVLHQLSVMALDAGDLPEAIRRYDEASEIRRRLGNRTEDAWSLHLLGVIHERRHELRDALELCLESLTIFRQFGDQLGIAGTLNRLGMIEQDRGNLTQAETYYYEALDTFERIGVPFGAAVSWSQLGTVYQERGDLTTADLLFHETLETRKQLGDKRGMFLSLAQLGRLQQQQGNLREALELYAAAQREMPGWSSENARKVDDWIAEVQRRLDSESTSSVEAAKHPGAGG